MLIRLFFLSCQLTPKLNIDLSVHMLVMLLLWFSNIILAKSPVVKILQKVVLFAHI